MPLNGFINDRKSNLFFERKQFETKYEPKMH